MKIAVIGGGPGGYVAAIRAAQLGAEVTLIEKDRLGGTCLNVGCIPTKVLLHATELIASLKHAGSYGISAENVSLDWSVLQKKKNDVAQRLSRGVESLLAARNIRVISGEARFIEAHSLSVGGEKLAFDKAIIASGSVSAALNIPGAQSGRVITSTEALSLSSPPKSLVIVGGGVIGVELGSVYARLGCAVTIIEFMESILPNMDSELAALLGRTLARQGVKIHVSSAVTSISDNGDVHFNQKDGAPGCVNGEKILVAVGRRPNTEGLNLSALGVRTERGAIAVDGYMRTGVPDIYAIGDCTGGMMLAHAASEQGVVAAANAVRGDHEQFSDKTVPACVYTEPEFAMVGMTEAAARETRGNIIIGKFNLAANGKTMLMGGAGVVKIIADAETEEVLGLHILGPRATEMIQEGALALRLSATLNDIVSTVHAHPTVSEAIMEAASDAKKLCIHKI